MFNTKFEPEELYGMDIIKDIKIPKKKYIINKAFKKTTNQGFATNFVKTEDGLYCDINYEDDKKHAFTNVYVSIDYNKKKDDELLKCKVDGISIGWVLNAQKGIRDNLK